LSSKSINGSYEEYVLVVGDFDERIFLGEDSRVVEEIGTPAKVLRPPATMMGELAERSRGSVYPSWMDNYSVSTYQSLSIIRVLGQS